MMVCLSSRVFEEEFFVIRCVSSALVIWAAVPAGFETSAPGFGGHVNGLAGVMR